MIIKKEGTICNYYFRVTLNSLRIQILVQMWRPMPKHVSLDVPELPSLGLRSIFGDTVRARILDFLTLYRDADYSMSEIARNSHISWRSFNREFPEIVRLGLVKEVGKRGNARLYRFANPGNLMATSLVKLANQVAIEKTRHLAEQ